MTAPINYDPQVWWEANAIPVWDRFTISRHRPLRQKTKFITVHRMKHGDGGAQDALDFYQSNPTGVATVTIPGSYKDLLPTIRKWREEGIPQSHLSRAFCAYNVLIDREGWVYESLPILRKGAHDPHTNATAVGLAFLGDFREDKQLRGWERKMRLGGDNLTKAQVRVGREVFKNLLLMFDGAKVITHDQSRMSHGLRRKPCPGSLAEPEVLKMARWAEKAAAIIKQGPSRR